MPVPKFSLYGEPADTAQELLHVEEIQARSRAHRWAIQTHLHQGLYQIVWIAQGAAKVVLDERRDDVPRACAVVVPPGVVHGFRFAPETQGYVLTLSPRFLLEGEFQPAGEAFRDLFSAPGAVGFEPGSEAAQRMNRLFDALMAESGAADAPGSPVAQWLARSVVWRLAQARLGAPREDERAWRSQALYARFTLLVEAHYLEHWGLERYASTLGLSIPRLNRIVRAESGRGALDLVHERLTREACRRLAYVAAPAATIAADLGFDDPGYFNRFFKRRTGMTPRRWRVAHRQPD